MTTLHTLARTLTRDGRLSTRDANALIEEARRAGAAEEVRRLLDDPAFAPLVTAGARRSLRFFLSAQAPAHRALAVLPDGQKLFLKEGVFVETPDAELPRTPQAFGQSLYRAARVFAEPGQSPADKLSLDEKTAITERVLVGLAQARAGDAPPPGYDDVTQAAQQRSASATVLRELLVSLKGEGGQARLLQDRILDALVGLIEQETDPGLRDHMAFHLYAVRDALPSAEQRARVEKAFGAFAPVSPPYDEWFQDGNRTLNVVCHTGSEFFASEVRRWKGEGFQVVSEGQGWNEPTVLEKKLRSEGGEEITVRLKMYSGQSGTFDPMDDDDVHVVAYSGHSGRGKNMIGELRRAPNEAGPRKVILIHQCCGQGIINKVRDKYPKAHLVTTRYSSYEQEDFFAFKTFLNGVAQRKSWEEIHDDIASSRWNNSRNNYITPADELTRMKVRDRDGDGKADLLDRIYDFDTFDVPGDTATAFEPKPPVGRDQVLAGERLHNASQIVNVSLGFSHFLEHMERENAFVSGGYFHPEPSDPDYNRMIRIVEREVDAKAMGLDHERANLPGSKHTVYELQLNSRFAHASEEVIKAVSFFEVGMRFARGGQGKADQVLMSLLLVAHSLGVDDAYGRDQLVFEELVKHYGLPDELTYADAMRTLKADEHVYAGSRLSLKKWKEALGPEVLRKVEARLEA